MPKKAILCIVFVIVFYFLGFIGTKKYRLLNGARNGHWERVEKLIKSGTNINAQDSFGYTPLQFACYQKCINAVSFLLSNGADVNICNKSHKTCLHISAQQGNEDIVRALLENGAIPSVFDNYGETPLFYAVRYGHSSIVEILLNAHSEVNVQGKHGWAPLHIALRSDHIAQDSDRFKIVSLLLEYNADINFSNVNWEKWESEHDSSPFGRSKVLKNEGGSPLEIAVSNDFEDIIDLLKEYGAKLPQNGQGYN